MRMWRTRRPGEGVLVMLTSLIWVPVGAAGFLVVWLVLGLYALRRAREEDIPAVIRALARWGRK